MNNFISEMNLRQYELKYSACSPLTRSRERIFFFKKRGDTGYLHQNNYLELAFFMSCFMVFLKIYLEKQLLIKYHVINHLALLKIQNMIDINAGLL